MSEGCIFCGIVEGSVPSKGVLETEHCVAFRDINPAAPVHVLVVTRRHIESFHELATDDPALLGGIVDAIQSVARQEGVDTTGYRVVTNSGEDAGQLVPHVHFHVIGGRSLRWPPKGSEAGG